MFDVELKRKIGKAARTVQDGSASTNLPKGTIPQKSEDVKTNMAEAFEKAKAEKEGGQNRYSKQKKSLYNFSDEKPKSKIVEKTKKLQAENDAEIKKMVSSNNADEVG